MTGPPHYQIVFDWCPFPRNAHDVKHLIQYTYPNYETAKAKFDSIKTKPKIYRDLTLSVIIECDDYE